MRSTQLITGSLAVAATSALIGLGAPATADTPTTTREKGIVLDCTGTLKGRPVIANLYENDTYGNSIEIQVGKGAREVGAGRQIAKPILRDGRVRATVKLAGKRAVVKGTAHRVGKPIAVHEEYDDAGEHIVVDGVHRRLANRLTFTWGKRTTKLTCGDAFAYNLRVTKESTVD